MQPAIRAGRALLPLQKLLADNGERDVTAMRGSAVLEQKNSLPGAELHLAINNRHTLARARQDHPNVRGHVVRALIVVFVVRAFGNELLEKPFDIAPCLGGRVLHRGQAATRVLHENRHDPVPHIRFVYLVLNSIGNFVSPLAICGDLEFFVLR